MALQFAQAQGKAITGQYIFQLANQIIQDPNGVLAQAILQLVNQDDGGRTSQTTTIIKNVIKIRGDGGGDHGDHGKPPPCKQGYHWDNKEKKCVPIRTCPQSADAAQVACEEGKTIEEVCANNPSAKDCNTEPPGNPPPEEDPCKKDPTAEGCPPPEEDICKENPNAEGCETPSPPPPPPPPPGAGDTDAGDTDTDNDDVDGGGGDDSRDNGDSGDSDDSGGSSDDGGGDAAKPT